MLYEPDQNLIRFQSIKCNQAPTLLLNFLKKWKCNHTHTSRLHIHKHCDPWIQHTACMCTQTVVCRNTPPSVLIKVCWGSGVTGRRADMLSTVNRSGTHQGFNHLVLQWVRKQGKDNMLLRWPPLLSQIYDPLSNISIYSAVQGGGRESRAENYPWPTPYLSLPNIFRW